VSRHWKATGCRGYRADPSRVHDLDEADSALDEASGQEAVAGVGAGAFHIRAVHLQNAEGSLEMSSSSGTLVCIR